jgi:hypothetical protein
MRTSRCNARINYEKNVERPPVRRRVIPGAERAPGKIAYFRL